MTEDASIFDAGTETSISAPQLTSWLKDLDRHGPALLEAVRTGNAKVTTAAGFSELSARLRSFSRAYADEALKVSELTMHKIALVNALYCVLKSLEGIAAQHEKIGELLSVLPLEDGLDGKGLLGLLLDGRKRDIVLNNGKLLVGAFDPMWLSKIDVHALEPILRDAGLDFTAYRMLMQVLKMRLSETSKQPEIHD